MQFTINETPSGVVTPSKTVCKVKGCTGVRFKSRKGHAFCKTHSGLKNQMSRAKFKELQGNNELVVAPEVKRKGISKKKRWKAIRDQLLGVV